MCAFLFGFAVGFCVCFALLAYLTREPVELDWQPTSGGRFA